jgi:hypothetical protein
MECNGTTLLYHLTTQLLNGTDTNVYVYSCFWVDHMPAEAQEFQARGQEVKQSMQKE